MIFEVTKNSTLFANETVKPMDEAKKIEGLEGWFIEVETLDKLIILLDKYGVLELGFSTSHQYKVINIPD